MRIAIVTTWMLLAAAARAGEVTIPSSLDGAPQAAILDVPAGTDPKPLLVHLHSWSSDYRTSSHFAELREACARKGWVFLSPDFRGPNQRPEACASDLAVQDVLDAVLYAFRRAAVDPARVYLTGGSGGGHMSLVLAHRAPDLWAAVSAFVPITDLAEWVRFTKEKGLRYAAMIEACAGGPPGAWQPDAELRRRSPLFHLAAARGVPIDIQAGIRDGHTGSVPVSHSLLAFNALADANGLPERKLDEEAIRFVTREARIPPHLAAEREDEPGRQHRVLFRRAAGPARVTLFDGGHDTDFGAALRFLEAHRKRGRGELAVLGGIEHDRVFQRTGKQAETRIEGVAGVTGVLELRAAHGPWRRVAETQPGAWSITTSVPAGGPYPVELRVLARGGRIAGHARFERILAGDLWILAGQSNMVGRARMEREEAPDPRVHLLRREGGWALARHPLHESRAPGYGHGLGLSFAKEMVRRTGVPIGLIPTAVGGTSLAQWDPAGKPEGRRSLYGALLSRCRVAGGRVAGILWYQGESDAGNEDDSSSYGERFARFVRELRADLGQPELPFFFAQLSRYAIGGRTAGPWNQVQEAQRAAESRIPHTGLIATVDLELDDPIHLDQDSLSRVGVRFARRVLDGPGPRLGQVRWESWNRLRVQVKNLDPAEGRILGFQMSTADGTPYVAIYRARWDGERGEMVLELGDTQRADGLHLWYGRGLDPGCTVRSRDDRALPVFGPLPLPPRPRE